MNEAIREHNDLLGRKTVEALQKNRFSAAYCATAAEAREKLLSMIPAGSSVGFGGSATIQEMDIQKTLKLRGCTIYDHNLTADPAEKDIICHQELLSDVFLTGCNAITRDGKLFNMDGKGNRVAAMIYGPKQVIIVAGINKVVADLAAAENRVEQEAAPVNCIRLKLPTPCTQTGYCVDCSHERRICNAAVVLHRQPSSSHIMVLLVGESCGF